MFFSGKIRGIKEVKSRYCLDTKGKSGYNISVMEGIVNWNKNKLTI